MRVIAGQYRGRMLKSVPGYHTRPTSDKIRAALFNMIGPFFEEGRGLDLFAGTGALGIEGLSRGLEHVIFVDRSRQSIQVVKNNLRILGLENQAEVYRMDARKAVTWLTEREVQVDLLFLDPPYALDVNGDWLTSLAIERLLKPGAQVVVEHDARVTFPVKLQGLEKTRERIYRSTAITIFQYT